MRKVGIYSGTFDPVHQGHVAFCREAMRACKLDEVILLPERKPRAKRNVTSLSHRLEMLHLATAQEPHMRVLELPDAQFTVQHTLPELQKKFAGAELYLLVGSDVVRTFTYRWKGLDKLLAAMPLIIGMREQEEQSQVQLILQQLSNECETPLRYTIIESPHQFLASLRIRNRQHAHADLHPHVAAYITRCRLYDGEAEDDN